MQITISLITAITVACLGYYLAINQYRKQKLWESKHKAYSDVIEAIFSIYYWAEENYASTVLCLPSSNTERLKELRKEFENARYQLWKTVKTGALILDVSTINVLDLLIKSLEEERFRYIDEYTDGGENDEEFRTHCEKIRNIIDNNLPHLIEMAKTDIEVPLEKYCEKFYRKTYEH